jgi:hypothetical protein
MGGAGAESISIVHTKAIRDPIVAVAWKLGELISPVSSGRKIFLQLVIRLSVIPTDPN